MYHARKVAYLAAVSSTLISCTSSPHAPEFKKSRVIERIGDLEETPKWATGEISMYEEKGNLVYVNATSMSGDARTEACIRAAEERGRAEMLRFIKDNVTASGQLSEESASRDPAVESLIAFLSQGQISGARIGARYWEKREETDASGNRVLRIRCAAQVTILKSDLESQMRTALNGGRSGNPEIRERLLNAQKSFIDNLGKGTSENLAKE